MEFSVEYSITKIFDSYSPNKDVHTRLNILSRYSTELHSVNTNYTILKSGCSNYYFIFLSAAQVETAQEKTIRHCLLLMINLAFQEKPQAVKT